MKVKELIEKLQMADQDIEVKISPAGPPIYINGIEYQSEHRVEDVWVYEFPHLHETSLFIGVAPDDGDASAVRKYE